MEDCCGERDKSLFSSGSLVSQHCTCISMFTLLSKKCTINMISGNFLINTGIFSFASFCLIFGMSKDLPNTMKTRKNINLIYSEN